MAHRLAAIGFSLREAGRNQFEIAGLPQGMIETFSKRSRQIEELVGRDATGAQKELAALATLGSKDEVPVGEILEARWKEELAQIGPRHAGSADPGAGPAVACLRAVCLGSLARLSGLATFRIRPLQVQRR